MLSKTNARGEAWRRNPRANGGTDASTGAPTSARQHSTDDAGRQSLYASNGKIAAWVTRDGCLCKQVDGSKHFLRKPAGIAFDAAILAQAAELGAARVWVKDRETGNTYRATLDAFTQHGVKLDRGFGAQVCLPFNFWQQQRPGAPVQLALL